MIDILVPVLNRPQNVKALYDSIRFATTVPHRIIWLSTDTDWYEHEAIRKHDPHHRIVHVFPQKEHDYPHKMNLGFDGYHRSPQSEFLLLASDDLDFQPGWDTTALQVAEQTAAGVIGTNDKANGQVIRGQFSTQPLVRRAYIEEYGGTATDGPGVLLHEGYDHNFVERELAGMAMKRGQWAFARNSIIRHRHPNWRTAPNDATYEKGLRNFKVDQELFFSRAHLWDYHGLSPAERRMARRAAVR